MKELNYTFFGKLLVSVLNFCIFMFLARNMDLTGYGLYSLGLAYAAVVNLIVFQFARQAVVRFGVTDSTALQQIYSLTLYITLAMSFLMLVVVFYDITIFLFLLAGVSIGIFEISQEMNRAKGCHYNFIGNAFMRSIIFSVFILLLYLNDSLTFINVLGAFSLAYILVSVTQLYFYKGMFVRELDFNFIFTFCKYTLPIVFSTGMVYIVDYFDRFYINEMLDSHVLGIYSAVYNLSQQTVGVILMSLNIAFYPRIVKLYETDRQLFKKSSSVYFSIMLVFISAIIFYYSVFGKELLTLILGEDYIEGYKAFVMITLAISIGCLKSYFIDLYFLLEKKTTFLLLNAAFAAAINILLNIKLIPLYGINGAALSTLISFMASALLSLFFSKGRLLDIKPVILSLIIICSFVMTVYAYIYITPGLVMLGLGVDFLISGFIVLVFTLLGFRLLASRLK